MEIQWSALQGTLFAILFLDFCSRSTFSVVQIFILQWSRRTYFAITLSRIDVLIMTNTAGLKLVCVPSEMMISFDVILTVHRR